MGACRAAGFEPQVDEHGAGPTIWTYNAQRCGVGPIVRSLIDQLPSGVETAKQLAVERNWT